MASHDLGRSAFAFIASQMHSLSNACQDTTNESESVLAITSSDEADNQATLPTLPCLSCGQKLLAELEDDEGIPHEAIEIVKCFALGTLYLYAAGKNTQSVVVLKSLFGLDIGLSEHQIEEKLKCVFDTIDLLNKNINGASIDVPLHTRTTLE